MSIKNSISEATRLQREGHYKEAIALYRKILENQKQANFYWIRVRLGELLTKNNHLDIALEEFQKAASLKPESAYIHYKLGEILFKKGDLEVSLNEFKKATKINSNCPKLYNQLLKQIQFQLKYKSSSQYWEERYASGGHSGYGSYDNLAKFKASVLNNLVKKENISSVIDFGCGDGNQLKFMECPKYIGLDVSKTAILTSKEKFKQDSTKSFFLYDPLAFFDKDGIFTADLALSLDVIYHLIEDEIYWKYLTDLFNSAKRFVVIYAWNLSHCDIELAPHIKPRRFTEDIEKHIQAWYLRDIIKNPYSIEEYGNKHGSYSNFYIYQNQSWYMLDY